ncbi:MAG: protein translocase subunit SecF [Candidatus Pacearchaeota archaeon]|nr:protein translocase subunit SecF [Candidatus Pacearchaeota archaeon]
MESEEDINQSAEQNKEAKTESKQKQEPKEEQKKEQKEEKEKKGQGKDEKERQQKPQLKFLSSEWYNKNYKLLLAIVVLLFLASLAYLFIFYAQHGDFMYKDVSLTGGTIITVYEKDVKLEEVKAFLEDKLGQEVLVRGLEDITTQKTVGFITETTADADAAKEALEEYLGYELTNENSSVEFSGSTLAKNFYNQLLVAMAIAFVFMAIVVFMIFRTFIPSITVVFAAAADIICALAILNLMGFRISAAGIAAFLMLIGYSVDTDTMLNTKVIKRRGEGTLNSRIKASFKTGIVMTLTALAAVLVGYFIAQASVLKEIFLVLSCGLFVDIITTWLGNASIIKWYCEKKKIS